MKSEGSHVHSDLESRVTALEALLQPTEPTDPDRFPGFDDADYTVSPDDDLYAALSSVESSATIGLARGTWNEDFHGLRPGQTLVGELDPQTADQWFPLGRPITRFSPSWAGATLRALEGCRVIGIEVSGVSAPNVAISLDAGQSGSGRLVYIYAHHNTDGGIGFAGGVELAYFESSSNGRIGIKASTQGDHDVRTGGWVHHGLSHHNNVDLAFSPAWEAGGSKFLNHRDLVVEDMTYHDNGGPGHWTDHGGVGNIARRITAHRNLTGIMWEITTGGLIEDFEILDSATNPVGAGALYLSNAADITVRRGKVETIGSHAAIAIKDDPGRSPRPNDLRISEVAMVRQLPGPEGCWNAAIAGFQGIFDLDSTQVIASINRNTYRVSSQFRSSAWGWPYRGDWAAWQAKGFDLDSTLNLEVPIGRFE